MRHRGRFRIPTLIYLISEINFFERAAWKAEGFLGLFDNDFHCGGHSWAHLGIWIGEFDSDHKINDTLGGSAYRGNLDHATVVLPVQDGVKGQDDRLTCLDQVDINL